MSAKRNKIFVDLSPVQVVGDAAPMSLLGITANCQVNCDEILHSLWDILCATFNKTNVILVRPGRGVRRHER